MKIHTLASRAPIAAFSLLELMVVITIIAILSTSAFPIHRATITKARIMRDLNNQDQIVKACRIYAMDWNGSFPAYDTENSGGSNFSTSTEAFAELIRETNLGTESIFFTKGNPNKVIPPNQDGVLETHENSYIYVTGQSDTSPSRSPLTADEMESVGTYGKNHPWLKSRKAVVGYCGGQVVAERLVSKQPGTTVRGPSADMENIFEMAEVDESGRISGGLLHVDTANILLP